MKRYVFCLLVFFIPFLVSGQTYKMYKTQNYHNQLRLNTVTGAVVQIQDDGQSWDIVDDIEPDGDYTNRFCLYSTQNMWTFIELDTFTGRLWQVQFSVKGREYMFSLPINTRYLDFSKDRSIFSIQPLTSMYQFYLINDDTGEIWKFQWSQKGEKYRWIEKIK